MTNELCKKLKDAGFPQRGSDDYYRQGGGSPYVHDPTLSELIEECGGRFRSLIKEQDIWIAVSSNEYLVPSTNGSTPEEAVTNLWLALKK